MKIFGGVFFSGAAALGLVRKVITTPGAWGAWTDWLGASPFVVLVAVGFGILALGLRGRSKRRCIYREGLPAVATVDHETNSHSEDDPPKTWEIRWSFEVDGVLVEGRRESKFDAIRDVFRGDTIWVLYDPEDPNNNVEWPPL